MARQKKNIDGEIEPTKNTQEEIDAALSRACGQTTQPPQQTQAQTNVENTPKSKSAPIVDFELNANACFKLSSDNQDASIKEYIYGINNKINKECKAGGYSTNVTFRVTPNDWVNVQHIVDWYRAHGFDVAVDEVKQPQYGMGAGTMEYNFNISWVHAQ